MMCVWSKKMFEPKKFWSKNLWFKNFWSKKFLEPQNCYGNTILGPKNILTKFWFKKVSPGQMLPGQIWPMASGKKGLRTPPFKFGQNGVSNSWDIDDMDNVLRKLLCWQMSPWQLISVKDGPKKLTLKVGSKWVSNTWNCQPPWGGFWLQMARVEKVDPDFGFLC